MKRKSILRLPDPKKFKRKKKRVEKCHECKEPLSVAPGWGWCENCKRGMPLPVGWVLSSSQDGKAVYRAEDVKKEIMQDIDEFDAKELKREFNKELRSRKYLIIEQVEEA